ncbi:MAG: hypothetical protein INR71_10505, partial [Terriglobus roseus]|nr:hypothetical protein [Terriglobus roseus]
MPIRPHEVPDEQGSEGLLSKPILEDENVRIWALSTAPEVEGDNDRSQSSSSRKRSFDEFRGVADAPLAEQQQSSLNSAPKVAEDLEQEKFYDETRQGIVNAMFNSDWQFDQLHETRFGDVRLPATIFVKSVETGQLEEYAGPLPGSGNPEVADMKVWVRRPWPSAMVKSLPPTKPHKGAVSYIIRNHFQRGRFQPDKAQALGVPKTQYRVLTSGGSLTLEDGTVVTPDMVLNPGREGTAIAVVDIPSPEYVRPTVSRAEWQSKETMEGIRAFIWLLGSGVAQHPDFRAFVEKMSHLEHIVSSPDCCPNELTMTSAAVWNGRLHKVDPERFSTPIFDADKTPQVTFQHDQKEAQPLPQGARAAKRGLTISLEPEFETEWETALPPFIMSPPSLEGVSGTTSISREVNGLAIEARANIERDQEQLAEWASKLPSPDAEVTTLGTGSALPSKYRNVLSTLLRVPGHGSYLLDCGENTLGQLQRVFTPEELTDILKDLRLIWISHLHADHHLGTASVIKAWYKANHPEEFAARLEPVPLDMQSLDTKAASATKRLAIVSDIAMLNWLAEYAAVENFGHHLTNPLFISDATAGSTSKLTWAPAHSSSAAAPLPIPHSAYPALLGLFDIQSVRVQHCHGAKGVALTLPNGFKAAFSGDCRPSAALAQV